MNLETVLPLLPGTSAEIAAAIGSDRVSVAKYLYRQAAAGRVRRIGFRKMREGERHLEVALWDRIPVARASGVLNRRQIDAAFEQLAFVPWLHMDRPRWIGPYTVRSHVALEEGDEA